MDSLESKTEEKIGLPPEMRSLDEDLDELIFNQAAASEEGTRSCSKPAPTHDEPKDLVQEDPEDPGNNVLQPNKNWDLGPIGDTPKLAQIVDQAMKKASEEEVRGCDDDEVGKPKFGEIGIIEDGLDHELEEVVTFIPGTQVPDDGTSSVEEVSSSKEPELEDLKLEAEDDGAALIPGTAIPDNVESVGAEEKERDVLFIPGSPDPEIGVRIPEIEARFRNSLTPKLPKAGGTLTPDPPRHKISWGDDPPKVSTAKLKQTKSIKCLL